MSSSNSSSRHGGAVYLSNVDDFIGPSQACVNPLFTGTSSTTTTTTTATTTASTASPASKQDEEAAVIVPKKRRGRGTVRSTPTTDTTPAFLVKKEEDAVKASIADCLACSGCVTTAETVLMEEQHSLDILKDKMIRKKDDEVMVVTISPASWADLCRHFHVVVQQQPPPKENGHHTTLQFQQQFASLLNQMFGNSVRYVLDGNVSLQWSLQAAADEFVRTFQKIKKKNSDVDTLTEEDVLQQKLTPSMAVSSAQTQYLLPTGTVQTLNHDENSIPPTPLLPVLSSSCPATVCLIEKSIAKAVPHIQATKSPMSLAGALFKQHSHNDNRKGGDASSQQQQPKVFHLSIMPCHDKKLEASRKDFQTNAIKDVDIVITTTECVELLRYAFESKLRKENDETPMADLLREFLLSMPLANVLESQETQEKPLFENNSKTSNGNSSTIVPTLILPKRSETNGNGASTNGGRISSKDNSFFALGSGGYAEYIFRHAAHELFGYTVRESSADLWKPVTDNSSSVTKVSARVARQSKRRDYYQAVLYRNPADDTYSTSSSDGCTEPVLRFATAYGMQTLQRALEPFQDNKGTTEKSSFDYIEAMACPSGCLNGGGQIRMVSSQEGVLNERETPAETRQRVSETQSYFTPAYSFTTTATTAETTTNWNQKKLPLYTRYHVVPPLTLSLGATAGVEVKDTQW